MGHRCKIPRRLCKHINESKYVPVQPPPPPPPPPPGTCVVNTETKRQRDREGEKGELGVLPQVHFWQHSRVWGVHDHPHNIQLPHTHSHSAPQLWEAGFQP